MKRVLLIALLKLSFVTLFADKIYLKNGNEILAIVKEVNETEIKYKKESNPDGPVYHLDIQDVLMILYPNGEKDIFANSQANINHISDSNNDYTKNEIIDAQQLTESDYYYLAFLYKQHSLNVKSLPTGYEIKRIKLYSISSTMSDLQIKSNGYKSCLQRYSSK
ncbi:MAG: hypothetical protein IJR06_06195 [Paludibacteraceae bacterium]|nr:hypothetical protein [Paludibacteraceae bacterium]